MQKLLVLLTLLSQHGFPGLLALKGNPLISERIVGGEDSPMGKWPWQVSVQWIDIGDCGGSLISDSWVLTVAHCFMGSTNVSEYTIYLGALQLSDLENPGVVVRGVKQIIVHPDFTGEASSGDIALVELEEPVNFTSSILPVSLPSASVYLPEGTLCWATGWGDIKDGVKLPKPKTLQEVQLALIDNNNCEVMYHGSNSKFKLIKDDMLCAGYKEGKKDACQGDSGGPLVCNVNNVWMQIGIISWGLGCAEPRHPGVYTRVQYYLSWIQKYVTQKNNNGLKSFLPGKELNPISHVDNSSLSDLTSNSTEIKAQSLVGSGAHSNLWSMANSILIILGLVLLL